MRKMQRFLALVLVLAILMGLPITAVAGNPQPEPTPSAGAGTVPPSAENGDNPDAIPDPTNAGDDQNGPAAASDPSNAGDDQNGPATASDPANAGDGQDDPAGEPDPTDGELPDITGLNPGPNVIKDANSPTGYTVKFLYENDEAQSVKFAGDILLRNWEDPSDEKAYNPDEFQPGMMRGGGAFIDDMVKVEDYWYYEVPLAAGANQYWFYIDGNTNYMAPDPNNKPQWSPNSNAATKNAYNAVYVPYDEKQDYEPMADRAVENPLTGWGAQKGTWSYEPITVENTNQYMGVYLPYGYDANRAEPYKTIYMLHGGGQDESDWMGIGSVQNILDNLISKKQAEPAVLVSLTFNNNCIGNTQDGYANLFDVIIPFVESNYNVSAEAADRSLAGLSAGGGQIRNILNTDATKFGYYGPWSSSNTNDGYEEAENLENTYIMFGCGTYDPREQRKATPETLAELSAKGATCTYVEVAGAHDFNAWCQLFTLYVRDYLWQPEAFETVETPDITGLKPGPNVIKDANSPTGYTVKFLYENDEAKTVTFAGDIALKNWANPSDTKTYTPFEYKPGLMRSGAFTDDMVKVGDYWYYEVPLAAGANQYWFYIDGNTNYMAPDPNNKPQWSPNSNAATKNAYNAVYVPYDEKQDYQPMADRAVENPRAEGDRKGTWSYVPITVNNKTHYMGVYLPHGYDASREKPYKTIYVLHGFGQDESDWMGIGSVQNILDNLIAEGKTEPAVLVSLTTNNNCLGSTRDGYANLFNVVIPFVETNYNVSGEAMDRSFAGLSMGSANTQNIINTDADAFGYYGPWSGGISVKADTPDLDKTHILFGAGNGDFGAPGKGALNNLKNSGAKYDYVAVCGGHDFNAWCQLFAIYVRDYLWQPEAFEKSDAPDISGLKLGPNVIADENSPTGYTVKFLYEDYKAGTVMFAGDIGLKNWADQSDKTAYTPFQYRPGLMRSGSFTDDMVKVRGYWYYEVPLAAGANQYWFYINENRTYMVPDPNNMPQWSPNSNAATKNAYNAVYVPYDEKQDYQPMADRAVENPRAEGDRKGTWSYVPITVNNKTHYMGVYLPYGYDKNREEPYKTIYMLHGGGQDESDWMGIGSVQNILDNLIAEGKTEPAVLVAPTTNNNCLGSTRDGYANLFNVVIPFVETNYNVSDKAMDRSFAGLSMGSMNTQNIINTNAAAFGYYGPWSGGMRVDPAAKGLDQTHILFGGGASDFGWTNPGAVDALKGTGAKYDSVTVCGGHDFNAWCQLFSIYVRDYLWQPEAFVQVDLENLKLGPNVIEDANSPTGYTVKFLYENDEAETVTFAGDIALRNWADQSDDTIYTPFEYQPGMMRSGAFTAPMAKVADGLWYYEVPLAAGANQYWFYIDGNTRYMAPDPNNMPQWSPNSNAATKNAYNAVYVPYAEKQDYQPMADRVVENPRAEGDRKGTWSYEEITPLASGDAKQYMGVYLPYGYDASRAQKYKTIYMLHGSGQDESDWMGIGSVQNILDNLIADGATEPAVLVSLTFNNGGLGDMKTGEFKNLFDVVIPFVESKYNVSKEAKDRSFSGLSQGARYTQAIMNVAADRFGYFGPWSSMNINTPWKETGLDKGYGDIKNLDQTHILFGVGLYDNDRYKATSETLKALDALDANYSYVTVAGGHDFNTWCQLFAIYVRDYLWQSDAFGTPDLTGLKPGPNVIKDSASPTGYTVKFLYENDDAKTVTFAGDIALKNWADPTDAKTYTPFEYKPGLMRSGSFTDDMVKVGDYWYYEVPLAAGANQYWFYIDGNTSYMAPDPNNMPQWSPGSNKATKNAYNAVYVPYDSRKQNYQPMADRAVELPRTDGKSGTWSYVPVRVGGTDRYMGVYLPYGYDANREEPYKTIYVLHGFGQDESDWMGIGSVQNILDNLIAEGKTEPAVLVSLTTNNNCIGNAQDGYANLFNVVIPFVEARYNVSKEAMERSFAGLSMGSMNTQNIINTDADAFGYYGPWSLGVSVKADTPDLDKTHILFGAGNGDFGKPAANAFDALKTSTAKYDYVEVCGGHDFNTWCQLFAIYVRDYLWQPEAFEQADVDISGLELGPNVIEDENSPTGYTVKFLYENKDAWEVTFVGDIALRNWADQSDQTVYTPFQYQPGFMRGGGAYEAPMREVEDGLWYIEVPLAAGANQYWFYVNGNRDHWVTDENNPNAPIYAPDGLTGNARRAFNPVYVPYAEKQGYEPMADRAKYENPRTDGKTGTWSYVKLPDELGEEKYVGVYLPYGYDANREEPYKTIYMQHGSGQDASDWMNIGSVPHIMDNLLAEGKTEPAIVVTTDSRYLGSAAEGYPNVAKIVAFIETNYNVSDKAEDRSFAGLSMGGGITSTLINVGDVKFGYYGVFSAGARINADAKNLKDSYILIGAGLYDFGLASNEQIEALKKTDATFKNLVVAGAHDFNAWCQLFTMYARDYLWQPDAFRQSKPSGGGGGGGSSSGTTTPTVPPEEQPDAFPFTDSKDHWAKDAIAYVLDKGIMNGTSDSRFSPDESTTRGMIVTILYRLEGEPAAADAGFSDVASGQYYTSAIAWASANQIVNGYGDGRFGPNDIITREQLAAILYRYAQYKGYDVTDGGMSLHEYRDADQVSSYALSALQWAVSEELLQGVGTSLISPKTSATRAQAATILMRFCEEIAK